MAKESDLVQDRHHLAQAARWQRPRARRFRHAGKALVIELAYLLGERLGLQVWAEDEAGPYQTFPPQGRAGNRKVIRADRLTKTFVAPRANC